MTETNNAQSLSCGQIFAKWFCCRDDEDFTKEEKYQEFETGLNPKKINLNTEKIYFKKADNREVIFLNFNFAII